MEIHLQRGNASKLLARVLFAAAQQTPFHLASFAGGNKHNAIPREAAARVVVPTASRDAFQTAADQEIAAIAAEIRPADPDVKLEVSDASAPDRVWTVASTRRALDLLNALPHGVLSMSYDIHDLVETSTNLATVTSTEDSLVILMSTRSSVATAMRAAKRRFRAIAELAGAELTDTEGYPGWKPELASPLLARFQEVHRRLTGKDAEVLAIHAGLECGILREKVPGMDAISFGPIITGAHSPDEGVKIDSVGRFWELLKAVLVELAG
jgi:dipeptidase D